MKIIEAMKRVKANKEKIVDLQQRVANYCANLSFETPLYGAETSARITEWLQSCDDLSKDNAQLLVAIQRTNLATMVPITLGDNTITKSIAEWIWRRREYAAIDLATWQKLGDRSLREGMTQSSTGEKMEVKIVRHFDPEQRDKKIAMYKSEPHEIDAALEVVNAVTELVAA